MSGTHVVCAPCDRCKYTDCVVVCPVDCFYEDVTMLYINPDDCINCGACVEPCPVEAIFPDDKVPEKWIPYIELNAIKTAAGDLPNICQKKDSLGPPIAK